MRINRIQQFSVMFAFIMVSWAMLPFFGIVPAEDTTVATSIVLALIGIAYPLAVLKPQWNKALVFFEGIIFAAVGLLYLGSLGGPSLAIIGVVFAILSILAYLKKLPKGLLKFFYQRPK